MPALSQSSESALRSGQVYASSPRSCPTAAESAERFASDKQQGEAVGPLSQLDLGPSARTFSQLTFLNPRAGERRHSGLPRFSSCAPASNRHMLRWLITSGGTT